MYLFINGMFTRESAFVLFYFDTILSTEIMYVDSNAMRSVGHHMFGWIYVSFIASLDMDAVQYLKTHAGLIIFL